MPPGVCSQSGRPCCQLASQAAPRACRRALSRLLQDGRQQGAGLIEQGHRLEVQGQILRPGRPHADRVDPRGREAEEIVDHDRVERGTELPQPLRRAVEMAALVGGADHEHPHVVGPGRLDGGQVVLADVVPVQVDVVEAVAGDRLQDQGQGGVGGEAHVADAALGLPAPGHLQAASRPQGLLEVLRQVEAVDGEQIQPPLPPRHRVAEPQPLEAQLQLPLEGRRIGVGRHLALQDAAGIGQLGQQPAQLTLGAAVVAGGFDVVEARRQRLLEGGAQLGLLLGADLLGRQILPALLEAHPPQGENGHGQPGAAETPGGQAHGAVEAARRGRVRFSRAGDGRPRGWICCWRS